METTRTTMFDYDKDMMEKGDALPVEAFYNEGPNRPLYYFFYKQNSSSGGTSGGTGSQQPSSFDKEVKEWIENIKDDISNIKETESRINGTVSDIKQKLDDGICNCSGGSSLTIEDQTGKAEPQEDQKVEEGITLEGD